MEEIKTGQVEAAEKADKRIEVLELKEIDDDNRIQAMVQRTEKPGGAVNGRRKKEL